MKKKRIVCTHKHTHTQQVILRNNSCYVIVGIKAREGQEQRECTIVWWSLVYILLTANELSHEYLIEFVGLSFDL